MPSSLMHGTYGWSSRPRKSRRLTIFPYLPVFSNNCTAHVTKPFIEQGTGKMRSRRGVWVSRFRWKVLRRQDPGSQAEELGRIIQDLACAGCWRIYQDVRMSGSFMILEDFSGSQRWSSTRFSHLVLYSAYLSSRIAVINRSNLFVLMKMLQGH